MLLMSISLDVWFFFIKWRNGISHCASLCAAEHLRDLSSSLAAWAARSSPVGSKLLHLSLGLSPPPLEPPAGGGGGGGGWAGRPEGTSGWPLFRPNSHDMLFNLNKWRTINRLYAEPEAAADLSRLFLYTRASRCNPLHMRHKLFE